MLEKNRCEMALKLAKKSIKAFIPYGILKLYWNRNLIIDKLNFNKAALNSQDAESNKDLLKELEFWKPSIKESHLKDGAAIKMLDSSANPVFALDDSEAKKYPDFFEPDEKGVRLCEMSVFDNSFLIGLLKKFKPKKILEVGVSTGATTLMILDFLKKENSGARLYSVDLNDNYYRTNDKKTGFLALEKYKDAPNWQFFTGDVLPAFLDKIGNDIDFCILDTMHCLPGEILDFLAVYPFLAKNAVVVFHDVHLFLRYYSSDSYSKQCFATKVVLDAIAGDKIICQDVSEEMTLPNIAAVIINDDTQKYIDSVFSALSMPWLYIPSENQLLTYLSHFKKYYPESFVEYFKRAVYAHKLHAIKVREFNQQASARN